MAAMKIVKYEPLATFLNAQPASHSEVMLTFNRVEEILGAQLPDSAFISREWWSNQIKMSHKPQTCAWISAGFEVDAVHQNSTKAWVRFKRK
jgi:hypothetical protein